MDYLLIARPGANLCKPFESALWWDFLQYKNVWHIIISVSSDYQRQTGLNTIPAPFCHSHWLGSERSNPKSYLRNATWWHDHLWLRLCKWYLPARRWLQCSPGASLVCHSRSRKNRLNQQYQKDILTENVDHFNYLESTIADNKDITKEIKNWNAKATFYSRRLSNFWKSNNKLKGEAAPDVHAKYPAVLGWELEPKEIRHQGHRFI